MVPKILILIATFVNLGMCLCPDNTEDWVEAMGELFDEFGRLFNDKDVPSLLGIFHEDIRLQWIGHDTVTGLTDLETYFDEIVPVVPRLVFGFRELLDEREDQVVAHYNYTLYDWELDTPVEIGKGMAIWKCVGDEVKVSADVCVATWTLPAEAPDPEPEP